EAERFHLLVKLFVMCDDHAPFTRGEILRGIKTEADRITSVVDPWSVSAYRPTAVFGTHGMCGILDDIQVLFTGKLPDGIHVARETSEMSRKERPGPVRYAFRDRRWVDVAIFTDIRQNRRCPDVHDRIDGR